MSTAANANPSGVEGVSGESGDLMTFSQPGESDSGVNETARGENCCGSCNELIKGKTKQVQCEVCLQWFHLKCIEIPLKLYNCLLETPKKVHIYCDKCDAGAQILHHKMTNLFNEHEVLRNEVKEIHLSNTNMKKELENDFL